jgi:hypothetical protein
MSSQTAVPAQSATTDPIGKRMQPTAIAVVALYLVFISAADLYGLIKLWPYPTPGGEKSQSQTNQAATTPSPQPTPSNQADGSVAQGPCPLTPPKPGSDKALPDPECISFFNSKPVPIYLETRLLLLVILAGALGSLMHALRSLYWYTGNREMVWSWVAFYFLLPLTGALLSVIFYFVVRGGFFSPQSDFQHTSPFGFAALSALVGLFSPQATLKLKEVAETIFSKPAAGADSKPQESSANVAPAITGLDRTSGAANDAVVISGTGLAGVAVKFGDATATVSASSDTSLTVVVPENPNVTAPVDVVVTNSNGKSATAAAKFTYAADAASDTLDGHDVIKSNTTDEELPITEGGVA